MLMTASTPYMMTISRLTVDKLGVKLYDRVSAVLAELVANSYDADATEVTIRAPMDEWLARKQDGVVRDRGFVIVVSDNGHGMTPVEVNDFYLRVGAERRRDPKRGEKSRHFKRMVMGRKGVGKLAPFGICSQIEVITSGGDPITREKEDGCTETGYLTAHLTLDRDAIISDSDAPYHPQPGRLDQTLRTHTGTELHLRFFAQRHVPSLDDLARQLAQRFGINSPDWATYLIDTAEPESNEESKRKVGTFDIDLMVDSRITFRARPGTEDAPVYEAIEDDGTVRTDIGAGFSLDGKFYPITGYAAYSSVPYRDDLMAGIRIYCNGKIAAQTSVFNRRAGFTGEHDVRSYLIGELHADWLDIDEDLIQTDRRDILWSDEIGQAFEAWGQNLILKMGSKTRDPFKKKTWEVFEEKANLLPKIQMAFPLEDQESIRTTAYEIARMIGSSMRGDLLNDQNQVDSVVQFSLQFAPHLTLDQKLRKAADAHDSPLAIVSEVLKTARVAELSSFGAIADTRIKVIHNVENLKDSKDTPEDEFQRLLASAPWLIDPQWTPITSNRSFSRLRTEFEKFYEERTGSAINLDPFSMPSKRCDFVLHNQEQQIEIIEIKRPNYGFANDDMERMSNYFRLMKDFLGNPRAAEYRSLYNSFHITLVCDDLDLSGVHRDAYDGFKRGGRTHTHRLEDVLAANREGPPGLSKQI